MPSLVSPAPSADIAIGDFLWNPFDPRLDGAQPGPMTTLGSQIVLATGPIEPITSMPHPLFYQSANGTTWRRLPDSTVFAGLRDTWIDRVLGLAADGSGLIAVGMEQSFDAGTANARAWRSPDGETWTQVSVDDASSATMDLVYRVSGGFVAIGTSRYSFHAGMEGGAAIWISSDGRHWTHLPQREVPGSVAITSVAHGAGRYVAVGEAVPPGGSPIGPTAPIWLSTDGSHYAMLRSASAPPADVNLLDVIWTGSAFVATGDEPTVDARIWRSADGLSWQSVALPPYAPFPGIQAAGVAQTPTGLIAVGSVTDAAGSTDGMVWGSRDGRTWQQLAAPSVLDGIDLQAVEAVGGRVFVTGQDAAGAMRLWLLVPMSR